MTTTLTKSLVNYRSDFALRLTTTDMTGEVVPLVGCDFTLTFKTSSFGATYIASCIDGVYTNCSVDKDNILVVVFDSPQFSVGDLRCDLVLDIPDPTYPDGKRKVAKPVETNVMIVREATELVNCSFIAAVDLPMLKGADGKSLNYDSLTPEERAEIRGEAFTYNDFTPEQLEALKGEKGEPFTFADFTEEQLAEFRQPALDTAEEIRRLHSEAIQTLQSAEEQRTAAETLRVVSEQERANTEALRSESEQARANAESDRVVAEQSRVSAETSRDDAEYERENAERARANAERMRVIAESKRRDGKDGVSYKENLLLNSSFECDYEDLPPAWSHDAGNCAKTLQDGTTFNSNNVVELEVTGYRGSNVVNMGIRHDDVPVDKQNATHLTFTLWSYTDDVNLCSKGVRMRLIFYRANGTEAGHAEISILPVYDSTWEKFTLMTEIPFDAVKVSPRVHIVQNGNIRISNPKLEYGINTDATWTPNSQDNRVTYVDLGVCGHTFKCTTDGVALAESFDVAVHAFRGNESLAKNVLTDGIRYTFYDGNSDVRDTSSMAGLNVEVLDNNTKDATLRFSATPDLYALRGFISIPVRVHTHTYIKVFTWTSVKDGAVISRPALVTHTSDETSATIAPDKYHVWPTMTTLNISLGTAPSDGFFHEYNFEFTSGATPTRLLLPQNVKWQTPLNILSNKLYQVRVCRGIGTIIGVDA